MKKSSLFLTAFLIAGRHSSKRLLCLLCIAVLCGGLLLAVFAAQPAPQERPRIRVALMNRDSSPTTDLLLHSVMDTEQISKLVEFCYPVSDTEQYDAAILLPEGFLESVMSGENKSPVVILNTDNPLEAMWVRQLATASARALYEAQLGVYAVQQQVLESEALSGRLYDMMVVDVNLAFIRSFFDQSKQIKTERLSASGTLSLTGYYIAAFAAALCLCYGFLYRPAVENLRRFARQAHRKKTVLCAALCHVFFLHFFIVALLFAVGRMGQQAQSAQAAQGSFLLPLLLFTLLTAAFSILMCLLFSSQAACAAACMLCTAGMGLCAGFFLPLPLMPAAFTKMARFLPAYQAMKLYGAALGEPLDTGVIAAACIQAVLLLAASVMLWYRRGGTE